MHLDLDNRGILQYKSKAQQARFITESWAGANMFCPGCGGGFNKYANNSPVADFYCTTCAEDFELKSTSGKIGNIIPDGAYGSMIRRLSSRSNPNLLLLQYDADKWSVQNLFVIPKYYFVTGIIQKRPPLSSTARRAGWEGCNILIGEIPTAGRINIISNGVIESSEKIQTAWKKTSFLKEIKNDAAKGWILQTMQCIDRIGKREFNLNDIYVFENILHDIYPNNHHIRDKLRQQLQLLRNQGYLRFVGGGVYELA